MEAQLRKERYWRFLVEVSQQQCFPVAVAYLMVIPVLLLCTRFLPPLGLRKVLVVYNFLCSAMSLYSVVFVVLGFVKAGPAALFLKKEDVYMKHALLVYLASKYVELLDTIFMILRHRQRQITFLHVYHHSTILLVAEYAHRYQAWPPTGFLLGMNSFVHVCLYFYYGQTALFPDHRPQWKRQMTQLQITQFLIGMIHCLVGYLYHGFCVWGFVYGFQMFVLFSNFYYQAYIKTRVVKKSE